MTSGIILLNKRCAVIATDNPATDEDGNIPDAPAVFCISNDPPIAILVDGNQEIGGMPAEVVINRFADSLEGCIFESLEDYVHAFADFLDSGRILDDDEDIGQLIPSSVSGPAMIEDFINFWENFYEYCIDAFCESDDDEDEDCNDCECELGDFDEFVLDMAKRVNEMEFLVNEDVLATVNEMFADNVDEDDLRVEFDLSNCCSVYPEGLYEEARGMFIKYLAGSQMAAMFGTPTELTFVGYGGNALTPSLIPCQIFGHYYGVTYYADGEEYNIADGEGGGAIPINLSSRTLSFLTGADPAREAVLMEHIEEDLADSENLDEFIDALEIEFDYFSEAEGAVISRYLKNMSKARMIDFAASVMGMEAFSNEIDGGVPSGGTDIAFMSRDEGFIWIDEED